MQRPITLDEPTRPSREYSVFVNEFLVDVITLVRNAVLFNPSWHSAHINAITLSQWIWKTMMPKLRKSLSIKESMIVCALCRNGDHDHTNEVGQCGTCGLWYHQICAGVVQIPKGSTPWYCDACCYITQPTPFPPDASLFRKLPGGDTKSSGNPPSTGGRPSTKPGFKHTGSKRQRSLQTDGGESGHGVRKKRLPGDRGGGEGSDPMAPDPPDGGGLSRGQERSESEGFEEAIRALDRARAALQQTRGQQRIERDRIEQEALRLATRVGQLQARISQLEAENRRLTEEKTELFDNNKAMKEKLFRLAPAASIHNSPVTPVPAVVVRNNPPNLLVNSQNPKHAATAALVNQALNSIHSLTSGVASVTQPTQFSSASLQNFPPTGGTPLPGAPLENAVGSTAPRVVGSTVPRLISRPPIALPVKLPKTPAPPLPPLPIVDPVAATATSSGVLKNSSPTPPQANAAKGAQQAPPLPPAHHNWNRSTNHNTAWVGAAVPTPSPPPDSSSHFSGGSALKAVTTTTDLGSTLAGLNPAQLLYSHNPTREREAESPALELSVLGGRAPRHAASAADPDRAPAAEVNRSLPLQENTSEKPEPFLWRRRPSNLLPMSPKLGLFEGNLRSLPSGEGEGEGEGEGDGQRRDSGSSWLRGKQNWKLSPGRRSSPHSRSLDHPDYDRWAVDSPGVESAAGRPRNGESAVDSKPPASGTSAIRSKSSSSSSTMSESQVERLRPEKDSGGYALDPAFDVLLIGATSEPLDGPNKSDSSDGELLTAKKKQTWAEQSGEPASDASSSSESDDAEQFTITTPRSNSEASAERPILPRFPLSADMPRPRVFRSVVVPVSAAAFSSHLSSESTPSIAPAIAQRTL